MEGMDERLLDAAMKGNLVSFVEEARNNEIESGRSEEYFLSQTEDSKENILHLAILCRQNEFIEKVLKGGELLPRAVTDELIKQQDIYGETPLHDAVRMGNIEFFKLLFEYQQVLTPVGMGLSMQNDDGNTPLHLALYRGENEIATLLVKHYPDLAHGVKNNDGNTPLHVAAEVGNTEFFKLLLQYDHKQAGVKNRDGNTPLHVALFNSRHDIATLLLERHPQLVRVTNNMKETPLHLAVQQYRQIIHLPIKEREAVGSTNLGMIKFMIEKESCVACWQDATGATPLHKAASITSTYTLRVIRLILDKCPQSVVEVRDNSSKTFLHFLKTIPSYKEAKDLLGVSGLLGLINHQDKQGNTPLHSAAMNLNYNMVRALLNSFAERSIINNDGIAAEDLIQEHFEVIMEKKQMTMEVCEATERADVTFLKERLHKFGMIFLFPRDFKRRNILHKLMQLNSGMTMLHAGFLEFIKQVVERFPELICQVDLNGDTPLHILLQNSPDTMIPFESESCNYQVLPLSESFLVEELLELFCSYINRAQEEASVKGGWYDPPWLVQNAAGNTPLHEALRVNHGTEVVKNLLKLDIAVTAKLTNNLNETPLHLVGGRPEVAEPLDEADIKTLKDANTDAACTFDKNGLTPLLRAAQNYNLNTILTFLKQSPEATYMADEKYGKTLFHLLINRPSYSTQNLLTLDTDFKKILVYNDFEGNTPLHLAIKGGRFEHAINFLKHMEPKDINYPRKDDAGNTPLHLAIQGGCFDLAFNYLRDMEPKQIKDLLKEKNNAGTTPCDLIRSAQEIPDNILKLLENHGLVVGIRSVWDVPTPQIQEYTNTMGVVAALITTITFTAAFTVPGGNVEGNKGFPALIREAAFQAFMISNILAMCLSMMVLFCLLWVIATTDKSKSVVLMDFSLLLLLLSLYATLVAFMMGVYVTTIHTKPWIAIITLVLCSLLMLLMHKSLVMDYLVPTVKKALIRLSPIKLKLKKVSWYCDCCLIGPLKVLWLCLIRPLKVLWLCLIRPLILCVSFILYFFVESSRMAESI